ncbi:MAG: HEAT repeat domain-containing protein [Sedimentisphaerales bacterium]|nr:HEAT repeat domain-containing protein [Sedimentisphaerales bacterium]
MSKLRIHIILIIALLAGGAVQSFAQTVPAKQDEAKLIAVLKSADASLKEKNDACRGLSFIGTKTAIPALAALLGDEKLSHMARYGLEPIPDPAVDEAFRAALGKLKGMQLVGVIGSVGVRGDTQAVPLLIPMLQDPNPEVARATARALGNIGNSAAAQALQNRLKNVSGTDKLHVCEGLLRCAEALAAENQTQQAIAIYDQLRKLDDPHQARAGGLRGAILARGMNGIALLQDHLRSNDYILFSAACQTALEMPGTKVTQALTSAVNDLPADNQILVIWTLGKRGDAAALPTLTALAKKGPQNVRIEAIKAFPQIADGSAVPVLVDLLADSDRQISQNAQDALAAMPGREAHAAVMEMLDGRDTEMRLTALELIGRRRMTQSIPALLKAAEDANPRIRPEAIRRIGELGGPGEISSLLDVLMRLSESRDLSALERALGTVCTKTDDPQSNTGRLTSSLNRATPGQKSVLLQVLSVIGGPDALEAVRKAMNDTNSQVRAAAVQSLCGWKTADAAPDLLTLAKTSPDPAEKTAALRGYISLVRDENLSTDEKLAICKQAADLIQRNQETKLLLGVLGNVPSLEALSMAMAHLNDSATTLEASFAAVAISEKIVGRHPKDVKDALQKVLKATNNREVTRRAERTLDKIK